MREPAAIGFYPGDRKELSKLLTSLFKEKPKVKIEGEIVGLVAPHAGYAYSGKTAAKGYSLLKDEYETVIIIGPDHTGMARTVSVGIEDWQTPLGEVKVDKQLARKIGKASNEIVIDDLPHSYEHSIEVQLPFLQKVFKDPKIVPITVPAHKSTPDACEGVGKAIRDSIADKNVLVVASSDMTHFGAGYGFKPVDTNVLKWVKEADGRVIKAIENMNYLQALSAARKTTVCGAGPVCIAMNILKNNVVGKLIDYSTSYDVSKTSDAIVGYASIAFVRQNIMPAGR